MDEIPFQAEVPIPTGTYGDVDAMVPHCRSCQRCRLGATRTHAAVYRGNPAAPLLLIGEGPGQQEDLQGLPFVGPAGHLLDQILSSVGLDPNLDVFITNVVKCRPPGNRAPEPDEIAACRGYLREQVRLVDPLIVLLIGGTAVRGVTGDARGITKIRGQWREWNDRPCMPIFHPSYLLRNPTRAAGGPKALTWQDIKAVRARFDEMLAVTPRPDWRHGVRVRLAVAGDAEALCDVTTRSIREVCGRDYPPAHVAGWLANKVPATFLKWLADPRLRLFAGLWNGRIAGVGLFGVDGWIYLLYVAPEALGVGLGKALLHRMEHSARDLGLKRLQLKSTITARAFYEHQAFVNFGEVRPEGAGEGAIPSYKMEKGLRGCV